MIQIQRLKNNKKHTVKELTNDRTYFYWQKCWCPQSIKDQKVFFKSRRSLIQCLGQKKNQSGNINCDTFRTTFPDFPLVINEL